MLCGLATINHEKKMDPRINKARNCFGFTRNLKKKKKRVKVGMIE